MANIQLFEGNSYKPWAIQLCAELCVPDQLITDWGVGKITITTIEETGNLS